MTSSLYLFSFFIPLSSLPFFWLFIMIISPFLVLLTWQDWTSVQFIYFAQQMSGKKLTYKVLFSPSLQNIWAVSRLTWGEIWSTAKHFFFCFAHFSISFKGEWASRRVERRTVSRYWLSRLFSVCRTNKPGELSIRSSCCCLNPESIFLLRIPSLSLNNTHTNCDTHCQEKHIIFHPAPYEQTHWNG